MTLSQLESLTDDELAMALYIVNVLKPVQPPMGEIPPRGLTWFKHDMLVKNIVDCFSLVKPEFHAIYLSLLTKLGVKVEIKQQPPPPVPTETSSSV